MQIDHNFVSSTHFILEIYQISLLKVYYLYMNCTIKFVKEPLCYFCDIMKSVLYKLNTALSISTACKRILSVAGRIFHLIKVT